MITPRVLDILTTFFALPPEAEPFQFIPSPPSFSSLRLLTEY